MDIDNVENEITSPIGYGFWLDSLHMKLGSYYYLRDSNALYQLVEYPGVSNEVYVRNAYTAEIVLVTFSQLIDTSDRAPALFYLPYHEAWFEAQMKFEAIFSVLMGECSIEARAKALKILDNSIEQQNLENWIHRFKKNNNIMDLLDENLTETEKQVIFHTSYHWNFLSTTRAKFELFRAGSLNKLNSYLGEEGEAEYLTEDFWLKRALVCLVHLKEQPSHMGYSTCLLVDTYSHHINRQLVATIAYFNQHYTIGYVDDNLVMPVVTPPPLQLAGEMNAKHFYQMVIEAMNFPYSTASSVNEISEYAHQLIMEYKVKSISVNFDGLLACDAKKIKAFVKMIEAFIVEAGVTLLIYGRPQTLAFFREYGNEDIFLPYEIKSI